MPHRHGSTHLGMRELLSMPITAWAVDSLVKSYFAYEEVSVNERSFSFIDGVVLVGSISAVGGLLRLVQISEGPKPTIASE